VYALPRIGAQMAKGKKKRKGAAQGRSQGGVTIRVGRAPAHRPLATNAVHAFVDDQNLFWGIVNDRYGPGFRIDFGRLLRTLAQDQTGTVRPVASAYVAGVVPDDDSFWKIPESRGFTVRRGFQGARKRSKQDDAYLITDMMATIFEKPGPATIVLVAGDADYVPPLLKAIEKGWRIEIAFIDRGVSQTLEPCVHEFREIFPASIEHIPGYI
jgi:uncharacterized LabA/DUF88 family protein